MLQVLAPLLFGVLVLLALAIAVAANRTQIEHILEIQLTFGGTADAIAGVTHGLHIKADTNPVGAGLLHHRMGKPAHVQNDLGMLQRSVVTTLTGEQALDANLTSLGFIRPLGLIRHHIALGVVLVHRRINAALWVRCGSD